MKNVDENLKYIHECAKEKSNEILSRKQHVEIKILYLLQAVAILGGLSVFGKPEASTIWQIELTGKILSALLYSALTIAVITLMLGLNDNLLNIKIVKLFLSKKLKRKVRIFVRKEVNKRLENKTQENIEEQIEKGKFSYKETPFPDIELEEYLKYSDFAEIETYKDINNYYKLMIETFGNSARTGDYITNAKSRCFTIGLQSFIAAVILRLFCSCIFYIV
ncbi:hypothetical protein psyc5s11_44750 [Clostridium gelidum]|uniref:SMODS and SLOG-associating 2TM effector domain-containing protein n=1 Tax=Clostridium gelidum TaxID=704125 RepID=A0ABM7TAR4_9CLOT|nr:hypothetical protein [Clostridium gelidum]BCZ48408.1 hypothetical protein psyc5s11_44750 [Clostridium gelidum]